MWITNATDILWICYVHKGSGRISGWVSGEPVIKPVVWRAIKSTVTNGGSTKELCKNKQNGCLLFPVAPPRLWSSLCQSGCFHHFKCDTMKVFRSQLLSYMLCWTSLPSNCCKKGCACIAYMLASANWNFGITHVHIPSHILPAIYWHSG